MGMEVTMLMVRLNVKCSTFVLLMELEVLLSTVSSVPMELSSTRTTSSVTGGSTSTAPLLRSSTPSMTRLLLRENLWMLLHLLMLQSPPMELLKKMEPQSMRAELRGEEDASRVKEEMEENKSYLNPCNGLKALNT